QFNILLSAVAGAERVFSILDEDVEEIDETDAKTITETSGSCEFKQVKFSYEDKKVLHDISFTVAPGEMMAFVGHTGARKTMIVNLISKFYNYDSGKILLDGMDLKDIKRTSLRSHIAFVLQDTFLFKGNVRENIRYGRLDATNEDIKNAAKRSNAHGFIKRLPNGNDTMIDQKGSSIRKEKKKRLTIDRAMIAERSILI